MYIFVILGYCQWNDTSRGVFDWARGKGSTATSNTGPSVDHTKGKTALTVFRCNNELISLLIAQLWPQVCVLTKIFFSTCHRDSK